MILTKYGSSFIKSSDKLYLRFNTQILAVKAYLLGLMNNNRISGKKVNICTVQYDGLLDHMMDFHIKCEKCYTNHSFISQVCFNKQNIASFNIYRLLILINTKLLLIRNKQLRHSARIGEISIFEKKGELLLFLKNAVVML